MRNCASHVCFSGTTARFGGQGAGKCRYSANGPEDAFPDTTTVRANNGCEGGRQPVTERLKCDEPAVFRIFDPWVRD
jgi:hypothetical protein